jgi:hypothetical protein
MDAAQMHRGDLKTPPLPVPTLYSTVIIMAKQLCHLSTQIAQNLAHLTSMPRDGELHTLVTRYPGAKPRLKEFAQNQIDPHHSQQEFRKTHGLNKLIKSK